MKYIDQYNRTRSLEAKSHICGKGTDDEEALESGRGKEKTK